jgi:hypothetical protein
MCCSASSAVLHESLLCEGVSSAVTTMQYTVFRAKARSSTTARHTAVATVHIAAYDQRSI